MTPGETSALEQVPYVRPPGEGFLTHVPVTPVSPGLFRQVLSPAAFQEMVRTNVEAKSLLAGRVVWNVNSTSQGGGVAELLKSLIAYARGAGVDARWEVINATPGFFRITKRIHNQIQGYPGDGGELGEREHEEYGRALTPAALDLASMIKPGDVVILHDPQTAGMAAEAKRAGAKVIWRCHVATDSQDERAGKAKEFVHRYIADSDAFIFSSESFTWRQLDQSRVTIIPPSIDPFTPKNSLMTRPRAAAILIAAGVVNGYAATTPYFTRPGGGLSLVIREADMVEMAPLLPITRFMVQVSRWDRLKDPVGVMMGFASFVPPTTGVHLVLAGPAAAAIADDPEGAEVLEQTVREWHALPEAARRRVHIACLPTQDGDENAAIVNALQTSSDVVVQKSIAEGFGLTVAEAMWKGRPVVASRVGGIKDQIEDQKTGLLLDDPTDLRAFGAAVTRLLTDRQVAAEMGTAAQERVREMFLNNRHLMQYAHLLSRLVG
jgi:trehalose synthase